MLKIIIYFFLLFSYIQLSQSAFAQSTKRAALVIGVENYANLSKLNNAVRDADSIAQLLSDNGFDVSLYKNLDHDKFRSVIAEFAEKTHNTQEAFVFYSGHGMAISQDGKIINVLASSDALLDCKTRRAEKVIALEQILERLAHIPKKVALFDACRNDPLPQCRGFGFQAPRLSGEATNSESADDQPKRGLGRGSGDQQASLLIGYSSNLGETAMDGEPGKNSPFTEALLAELNASPKTQFREILDRTSKRVAERTGQQFPWVVTKGGEPEMCLAGVGCESSIVLSREKLTAQSEVLAQEAEKSFKSHDYATAGLLALESLGERYKKLQDFPASAKALPLIESAQRLLHEASILRTGGEGRDILIYPDRRRFVTFGFNEPPRVWDAETKKLLFVLRGNNDRVNHVVISPKGDILATGANDGAINLYSAATGEKIRSISSHTAIIRALAFHPNGKLLASQSGDQAIRRDDGSRNILVQEVETGQTVSTFEGHGGTLKQLAYSSDGGVLVGASFDAVIAWRMNPNRGTLIKTAKNSEIYYAQLYPSGNRVLIVDKLSPPSVYNTKTGELLFNVGDKNVSSHSWKVSLDNKIIAAITSNSISSWDANTGKLIKNSQAWSIGLDFLLFQLSDDGKRAVSKSINVDDPTMVVWELDSGKILSVLKAPAKSISARFLDFAGDQIVSVSPGDGVVRIWQVSPIKRPWSPISDGSPNAIAISNAQNLLAVAYGSAVDVVNLRTRKQVNTFKISGTAVGLSFSDTGDRLLVTDSKGVSRILKTDGMKIISEIKPGNSSLGGSISTLSPNGKFLITNQTDGRLRFSDLRLWDAGSAREIANLVGHTARVHTHIFSKDSKRLLTIAGFYLEENGVTTVEDNIARLWDTNNGSLIAEFNEQQERIATAGFLSNGQYVLTTSFKTNLIYIWDAVSGKLIRNIQSSSATGTTISNDSALFAVPVENAVDVYQSDKIQKLFSIKAQGGKFWRTLFSQDGTRLALFDQTGLAQIWDVEKQVEISKLVGIDDRGANKVVFSPDNSLIFITSWSSSSLVRVWQTATGREVAQLYTRQEFSTGRGVEVAGDGQFVVLNLSGPKQGTVVWPAPLPAEDNIQSLKLALPRCLTQQQKKAFQLPPEPHRWCITGEGKENLPRTLWNGKWPYDTDEWKDWLEKTDSGDRVELPEFRATIRN